jgi:hypothetical protein
VGIGGAVGHAPTSSRAARPQNRDEVPTRSKETTMTYRKLTLALACIALAALAACEPKPQPPKAAAADQLLSLQSAGV